MFGTFCLVLLFIAVFAWEFTGADPTTSILAGALVPYNLTHDVSVGFPVWLTPLTSLALHGGLWHLASNGLVLLAVGPAVERRCGFWRFVLFFVAGGLAGGLAQVALSAESHEPIIGASGAIAGLLAAYMIRNPLARAFWGVPVVVPILLWAVVQCIQSGMLITSSAASLQTQSAPIAYAAHVGGFVFGALMIGLFERREPLHEG